MKKNSLIKVFSFFIIFLLLFSIVSIYTERIEESRKIETGGNEIISISCATTEECREYFQRCDVSCVSKECKQIKPACKNGYWISYPICVYRCLDE